jgi:hypothetical protein
MYCIIRETVYKLGGETPGWIRACSLIRNKKTTIVLFEKTANQLRSHRPLHVQGGNGHVGGQGEAQRVADPQEKYFIRCGY